MGKNGFLNIFKKSMEKQYALDKTRTGGRLKAGLEMSFGFHTDADNLDEMIEKYDEYYKYLATLEKQADESRFDWRNDPRVIREIAKFDRNLQPYLVSAVSRGLEGVKDLCNDFAKARVDTAVTLQLTNFYKLLREYTIDNFVYNNKGKLVIDGKPQYVSMVIASTKAKMARLVNDEKRIFNLADSAGNKVFKADPNLTYKEIEKACDFARDQMMIIKNSELYDVSVRERDYHKIR